MTTPKTVAITGGIGSGKTTVINIFKQLGVPAYIADEQAKELMQNDTELVKAIQDNFGKDAYHKDGKLNKDYLSEQVFQNSEKLNQLNYLVHPAVRKDFEMWLSKQNAPYVVYESALVFEHNNQDSFDYIILVTAPVDLRIKRIQKRNQWTVKQIKNRINKQMDDNLKKERVNYIVENTKKELIKNKIVDINKNILNKITEKS